MADAPARDRSLLLDLPLELRLEIYALHFRTEAVWPIRQRDISYDGPPSDRRKAGLVTWTDELLYVCKQIKNEAEPVFRRETPLDLYTSRVKLGCIPSHITDTVKHVVCTPKTVKELSSTVWQLEDFSRLGSVTLIDASKLFYGLTQPRDWCWDYLFTNGHFWGRVFRNEQMKRLESLREAIAFLRGAGVPNILLNNAKHCFRRREIAIRNQKDGSCVVTMNGLHSWWHETAQQRIGAVLQPSGRPVEYTFTEFGNRWSKTTYNAGIPYRINRVYRDAATLNRKLEGLKLRCRAWLIEGKIMLEGKMHVDGYRFACIMTELKQAYKHELGRLVESGQKEAAADDSYYANVNFLLGLPRTNHMRWPTEELYRKVTLR